jgi:hypothetical protein
MTHRHHARLIDGESMAIRFRKIVFALLALALLFVTSGAYCRPLTSEDREVCRDMAEGNPTIYQRCEARAMATSKEEINCIAALLERATKEHMSEEAIRRAVDSCASR